MFLASTRAPFVGRQRELTILLERLDAARGGEGGLALVSGEPGIGKTRLVEEVGEAARDQGVQICWGRCYEGEGAPAFWPWLQVLRPLVHGKDAVTIRRELGAGAPDLARLLPEIGALLSGRPGRAAEAAEARFRLFEAVTTLLTRTVDARPSLCIILDDLHWADVPSLLLLEFLARHLDGVPLLIVGIYRDIEVRRGTPLARTLGELTRYPHVVRVALAGLGERHIARVIAEMVPGPPPSAALIAALVEKTAGNPLYVTEMARLLAAEGASPTWGDAGRPSAIPALPVPQTVREVIGRRLDRLSPECTGALAVASVIGREFGVDALGRAGELAGAALLEVLEEAEAARVIEAAPSAPGRYRFTHALIRETLYEDLPTTRQARLHARVGAALEAVYGADAEPHLAELAHHFAQAAPAGEGEKAVAYAERAAARAARLLAYEEAVRHYEQALSLTADEERRVELLLALGQAQARSGDVTASGEAFARAAALARALRDVVGPQRAAVLFARAAIGPTSSGVMWRSLEPDARWIGLLEEALAMLDEGDSVLRVRLLGRLADTLRYSGVPERRGALTAAAVAMARRCGDPVALADALGARAYALTAFDQRAERMAVAAEQLRLAEELHDDERALLVRLGSIADLLEGGDVPALDDLLAVVVRQADELRYRWARWRGAVHQAMRALLDGRFAEAERLAEGALTLGERLGSETPRRVFHNQLIAIRADQGRLAELEHGLPPVVLGAPEQLVRACMLAYLYAEEGRAEEARPLFERCAADGFAALARSFSGPFFTAHLAVVCAALGDADRAARLHGLLAPSAGAAVQLLPGLLFTGAVAHYLGLLADCRGRPDEAEQHFAAAEALHARMGARPWLARTRHAHAAHLLARGRPGDRPRARELAEQARTTARELGMARLAERCAALPVGSPAPSGRAPRPALPAGLSARELEVLRLVAAGKSNPEIGDELVLSVRTVERHLANLYHKIGAHSKAEATAYAYRHGLV